MRILITNDDGLHASQLLPLIKWCRQLGEVTAVVPKYEQSGKSHGIELHKDFEARQVELEPGITAWAWEKSSLGSFSTTALAIIMGAHLYCFAADRAPLH